MEEIFKKLGISEKTINEMMQICPDIKELEINEIFKKLEILKNIECEMQQTRNIVSSNPQYLIRTNTDINKTINKLQELGFKSLNILFDGNPYILNLDSYEIEKYINNRKNKGELLEDIVDDMDSNPFLFQNI